MGEVSWTVATAALLSTGMISLAPNVILLLFPGYAAGEGGNSKFLTVGQAMSAGGLLGDVFLHTLPHHAASSPDCGLWVLLGFTLFLAVDMLIRWLDPHSHSHAEHGHDHKDAATDSECNGKPADAAQKEHHSHEPAPPVVIHHSAVFLNLAADALHNFTDGLAIGASYALQSNNNKAGADSLAALLLQSRGSLASISILLHEVPHELGDFCTLVRAGYSKTQAVLAQMLTALAAFLGTIVALTVSSGSDGVTGGGGGGERLLFVTAGGFVYLAATTLLPEVLEGSSSSLGFRLLQLTFFVAGIMFLYLVAYLEEAQEGGHDHHHHHHGHGHHHHHHEHHAHEHEHEHHHHEAHEHHHEEL